jgi:hypothetical protein
MTPEEQSKELYEILFKGKDNTNYIKAINEQNKEVIDAYKLRTMQMLDNVLSTN